MTRPPTDEPDTDGTSDAGRGATKEVYGFVAWIATFFLFGAYLLWAYLPESWLHAIGVTYYPDKYVSISIEVQAWFGLHNGGGDGGGGGGGGGSVNALACCRYWALAVPTHIVVTGVATLIAYYGINRMVCQHLDALTTIRDRHSHIEDMPIQVVNQLLYSRAARASKSKSKSK
jgi:hypothetical protein